MVQGPGELVGPMLWLVPRYSETPESVMRLGSILTDPRNLESSLNLHEIPPIPEVDKRSASQALRLQVQSQLGRSNSQLAKAVPNISALSGLGLGASISAGWHRDTTATINALDVSATVFIPSPAYMDQAMQNEAVQRYARDSLFGKPVYIIVGTATARKLSIREERSRGHNAGAGVHVEAAAVGEAEATFDHATKNENVSEFEVGEACDFAYRIREVFYSRLRKRPQDRGNYTRSALFGRGEAIDGDLEGEDIIEVPKFEWFEEEDPAIDGAVTIPVDEANDI